MPQGVKGVVSERWSVLARLRDRLLSPSASEPGGLPGAGVRLARISYFAYREFAGKFCWERAGSLAFTTLISLIPICVLFMSFIGEFWGEARLKAFVFQKVLVFMIPDESLRTSVSDILDKQITIHALQFQTGVNLLAVAGLVMSSAALLVSTERVFNRLWDVSTPRTYLQKLGIFWIILTTSPVALAASIYFDQLTATGSVLGQLMERHWMLRATYSFLLPLVVAFAAFTVLNVFLPNTRVHLRPALLGSLAAALLWEGAKKGFYLYLLFLKESEDVARFYGSLALLPVFFLWIYISWLILLLGAVMTHCAQNLRQFTLAHQRRIQATPPPAALLALFLLERTAGAFRTGRAPPPLEGLATQVGVLPEHLEPLAVLLVEKGILVEDARNPGIYVLGRPPDQVKLSEVVEVFAEDLKALASLPAFSEAGAPGGSNVFRLFREARRSFQESLGQKTLQDLIPSDSKERG